MIPMALGGYLIASHFVPFFLGHEFTGSIIPIQILSFKIIVIISNIFLSQNILMAFGYENKLLITVTFTAIFSVIMNLMFIPRYGAIGAAITALISECFEVLLQIFILFRFTKIRIKVNVLFISILFALPFFIFYHLFNMIIKDNITFLTMLICVCTLLYLVLQRYWAKNYLIIQLMNLIINKINKFKHI
jgi:O-antigen/teichoic acid export membrane protein